LVKAEFSLDFSNSVVHNKFSLTAIAKENESAEPTARYAQTSSPDVLAPADATAKTRGAPPAAATTTE
jgi:hypothetical protein